MSWQHLNQPCVGTCNTVWIGAILLSRSCLSLSQSRNSTRCVIIYFRLCQGMSFLPVAVSTNVWTCHERWNSLLTLLHMMAGAGGPHVPTARSASCAGRCRSRPSDGHRPLRHRSPTPHPPVVPPRPHSHPRTPGMAAQAGLAPDRCALAAPRWRTPSRGHTAFASPRPSKVAVRTVANRAAPHTASQSPETPNHRAGPAAASKRQLLTLLALSPVLTRRCRKV